MGMNKGLKRFLLVVLVFMMALFCIYAADSAGSAGSGASNSGVNGSATSGSETLVPKTLIEKFSYVVGYRTGSYYYAYKYQLYPEMLDEFAILGDEDYTAGTPRYTATQMDQIVNDYIADYTSRRAALAVTNLQVAEDFLAENAKSKDVHTTSSGLQYRIIKQGTGAHPQQTDTVELAYELKLLDGTVMDSSYARGSHSSFPLTNVIAGFSEGCQLMPLGSHYIFYIHPDLGYGENGAGTIEPNSLLVFEVETYSIVE